MKLEDGINISRQFGSSWFTNLFCWRRAFLGTNRRISTKLYGGLWNDSPRYTLSNFWNRLFTTSTKLRGNKGTIRTRKNGGRRILNMSLNFKSNKNHNFKKKKTKKSSKKKSTKKEGVKNTSKNIKTLKLQTDHEIATDFAIKAYKKFDKIVKSIILFGSVEKKEIKPGSDIDIIIVIDDISLNWDQELIAWYREELEKILQMNPYKGNIHVNTIKLSTWWDDY